MLQLLSTAFLLGLFLSGCSPKTEVSAPMPRCVEDNICIDNIRLIRSKGSVVVNFSLVRKDGSIDNALRLNPTTTVEIFQETDNRQIASLDLPTCKMLNDTQEKTTVICSFIAMEYSMAQPPLGRVRLRVSNYDFETIVPVEGEWREPNRFGLSVAIVLIGAGMYLTLKAYKTKNYTEMARWLIGFVGMGLLLGFTSMGSKAWHYIPPPWNMALGPLTLIVLISHLIFNLWEFLRNASKREEEWCGD